MTKITATSSRIWIISANPQLFDQIFHLCLSFFPELHFLGAHIGKNYRRWHLKCQLSVNDYREATYLCWCDETAVFSESCRRRRRACLVAPSPMCAASPAYVCIPTIKLMDSSMPFWKQYNSVKERARVSAGFVRLNCGHVSSTS